MYESPIYVIVQEASEHIETDLLNNITKLLLRYDIKVDSNVNKKSTDGRPCSFC